MMALTAAAVAVGVGSAPPATAEIVPMAPHERSFESPFGGFTVGTRDETINRLPPMNMVGTTREALVSLVSYASIEGPAGGVLRTGYHVGCAVAVTLATLGSQSEELGGFSYTPGATNPYNFNGYIAPEPLATVNIAPGEVKEVQLAEKELIPGKTVSTIIRDFHIIVNACEGPVTIRQYAYVYAKSAEVDDSGAIFGDPAWL
ncbi:hypothetical protein NRB56_10250 [Nocardia sp. RB56]|uniref:MspA protein n=1 Tax=Nocardia aurantia TaxID=2585199 RepID=A0A7K0DIK0_9NOCA|nr:hypothetical protein [Nocardia aurantia]